LDHQLQERVNIVKNEIAIAAFIENVNLKGNIIEYLITSDASATRNMLIDALVLPPKIVPSGMLVNI
jgi:hypothetical protein